MLSDLLHPRAEALTFIGMMAALAVCETVEALGMKRDASDSRFRRFGCVVFSVADHWVADGGKLHSDLILQSGHQGYADQGGVPKRAFYGIPHLGTGRFGVSLGAHFLQHAFAP